MVPKITWFRHGHENRNDLLRFGLMRLHYQEAINYTELPFEEMKRFGFSKAIWEKKDPRHISFLQVQSGKNKVRCMIDTEDSFALISPLITEVDVCFCSGYNSDFFEKRQFVKAYSWQTDTDVEVYRGMIEKKISSFGQHFGKIKKFVPIAPNQGTAIPVSPLKQKYKNAAYRLNRFLGKGNDFSDVYRGFEIRERYLKDLRKNDLKYDVVLNDSLWGWPQHRINLHRKLQELSHKRYRIHSILNYVPPVESSDAGYKNIRAENFPLQTLPINEPYETMVAKSRLAVYACGFHWGWRNIMMLALQAGIPVLTDRLLTEPYFDMNEFSIIQQESHNWDTIEATLNKIDDTEWHRQKVHNQLVYDKYMSPESVARYFIRTLDLN
jgi:hypothetical protein